MKKILSLSMAILLIASLFVFSSCEATISLPGEGTTIQGSMDEADTVVYDVTNEEGTVIGTQTVTMSAQDKEVEKNFFTVDKKPLKKEDILADRIEQAIQQNKPNVKPSDKNDSTSPSNKNDKDELIVDNLPYVQDDAAILNSEQYMINVTVVTADGAEDSYKIARKNKISSISFIYNDYPMSFIMGGETWYWLSNSDKTYLKIPKSMIEENATDEEMKTLLLNDPFDFNRKVKTKTTEVLNDTEYNVTIYEDGTKDYFIGKTIIHTLSPDGSIMIYQSVSPIAPSSLFTPPADYTEMELNDDSAGDMMDAIAPTTEEHTHAE